MIKFLVSSSEYQNCRKELISLKLDFLTERRTKWTKRLLSPKVGDVLKSWDIVQTLELIQEFNLNSQILDFGAYGSELPWCLSKIGFINISGIDLNKSILKYPNKKINWIVGDFHDSKLPSGKYDCITAISVIEHGFKPEKLLREVNRLLKNGGKFIFSFDYWPNKIDTSSEYIFDLSWTIFSKNELLDFIKLTEQFGFKLTGEIDPDPLLPSISYNKKDYTFGLVSLEKVF